MSKKIKLNYVQQLWKDFISSFKEIDKRFLLVIILDILLILLIYTGIIILWRLIMKKLNYVPPMPIFNPEITSESELKTFYENVLEIRTEIILYLIVFLTVIFLGWTLIKSLQWKIILKKKSSIKFYLKNIALNIVWQLAWLLIFIANFLLLRLEIAKPVGIFLFAIYLHLSYIKYIHASGTEKIFGSIISTLKTGILRFYRFIVPYAIMAIVLILLSQLYYIYRYLPDRAEIAIFGLIILFWLAWARIYVVKILDN